METNKSKSLLRTQLEELRNQLQIFEQGDNARQASNELESIVYKIEPLIDSLIEAEEKLQIIGELEVKLDAGEKVSVSTNLDSQNEALSQFKIAWLNDIFGVRQNDVYPNFNASLINLEQTLTNIVGEKWSQWCQQKSLECLVSEGVTNVARKSKEAQEDVRHYDRLVSTYNGLISNVPNNKEDAKKLRKTCENLAFYGKKIQGLALEIPESVLSFLAKIDSIGSPGVALEAVTKELFTWLENNGELDSLVVKRKPR